MKIATNFRKNLLVATLGKYAGIAIALLSLMILSRLVEPRLHGYIAYVAVFITFYELLVDSYYGASFLVHKRITKNELAQDYMANYRIGLIIFLIGVLFCGILIDNVRDKIMIILFFPFILVLRGHLKIEQIVAR